MGLVIAGSTPATEAGSSLEGWAMSDARIVGGFLAGLSASLALVGFVPTLTNQVERVPGVLLTNSPMRAKEKATATSAPAR